MTPCPACGDLGCYGACEAETLAGHAPAMVANDPDSDPPSALDKNGKVLQDAAGYDLYAGDIPF